MAGGRVVAPAAAYANVLGRVSSRERPEFSTLLRKTLPVALGGLPHAGGADFETPEDPRYRQLLTWVASEPDGREGLDPATLTPLEQTFEATVLPGLVRLGCMRPRATATARSAARTTPCRSSRTRR